MGKSVSAKTDILIRGTDKDRKISMSSVKLQKAINMNIDILNESDYRVSMLKLFAISSSVCR